MKKVLLVEDSEDIQNLVCHTLKGTVDVWAVSESESALNHLRRQLPDLILLDISLPGENGFQLFQRIRQQEEWESIPVIFLSAKEEIESKAMAFTLGAEDYLVKPFHPAELKLRILARLPQERSGQTVQKGPFKIEYHRQRIYLLEEKSFFELDLTPREFQLLALFIENESRLYTRNQLLDAVWGEGFQAVDRTVDRHISSLRKKLGEFSSCLQSVYGLGYLFKCPTSSKRSKAS